MKGFLSLFFLLALAEILFAQIPLENPPTANENTASLLLPLQRIELETGMDRLIREKLHEGVVAHAPGEVIQGRINLAIVEALHQFENQDRGPVTTTLGFASLNETHYLSLAESTLAPLSMDTLMENSHVLLLPIDEGNTYGEYAYTGGANGTSILVVLLQTGDVNTIFALPAGYQVCTTTLGKSIPCSIGNGGEE